MCCKLLRIAELDKPKDKWCPNFAAGTGCSIYADRPPSCREFVCRWLINPTLGPEWKPNVCKMVLDYRTGILVVHVDPAASGAWRQEPYYSAIRQMAAKGFSSNELVMVIEKGRSIVILPDREMDMGVVDPAARFQFKREMTPQGMQWTVRIMAPHEIGQSNK
jgi:hypothetical protein